jgi:hypothetical protein
MINNPHDFHKHFIGFVNFKATLHHSFDGTLVWQQIRCSEFTDKIDELYWEAI